jgi:NAD+--asparagine ADP-ribosyltransferase
MSHSEGLNSIETARAYVEQQREATAAYVLLFGRWCDLAAQKRKKAEEQIIFTDFFKK